MSQKGKRRRLSEVENKNDESAQIHKDPTSSMTPTPIFTNEIIEHANNDKSEDRLGYFVELRDKEELPEGKMGCYIPKTRSMKEEMDEFRRDIRALKEENASIRAVNQTIIEDNASLRTQMAHLVTFHYEKFENSVVQIGNSIQETLVLSLFENSEKLFKDKHPNFETVKNAKLPENIMRTFNHNEDVKNVAITTNESPLFDQVRRSRNTVAHPKIIEIEKIISNKDQIDLKYLEATNKRRFEKSKTVLDNLLKIPDLEKLIETYNSRNAK